MRKRTSAPCGIRIHVLLSLMNAFYHCAATTAAHLSKNACKYIAVSKLNFAKNLINRIKHLQGALYQKDYYNYDKDNKNFLLFQCNCGPLLIILNHLDFWEKYQNCSILSSGKLLPCSGVVHFQQSNCLHSKTLPPFSIETYFS